MVYTSVRRPRPVGHDQPGTPPAKLEASTPALGQTTNWELTHLLDSDNVGHVVILAGSDVKQVYYVNYNQQMKDIPEKRHSTINVHYTIMTRNYAAPL